MLWNSNFFMTDEAMKILRLLIDVWLPDFKFGPGRCALELARTGWYWETVTRNLVFVRDWGEDATIRHLVMPNHIDCCTVPVNIMDQYHPDTFCDPLDPRYRPRFEELSRRPNTAEVEESFRYARRLGLRFEAVTYEKNVMGLRV